MKWSWHEFIIAVIPLKVEPVIAENDVITENDVVAVHDDEIIADPEVSTIKVFILVKKKALVSISLCQTN